MQPASHFTPTSKTNYPTYVPPFKNQHTGVSTYQSTFTAVGSPKTNFQLHKIEERPTSHHTNLNMNINKNYSPLTHNDLKPYKIQNIIKPIKTINTQKTTNNVQQISQSRFGEMKNSYMGPDSRQIAYVKQKQQRQLAAKELKSIKRPARHSEVGYPHQFQANQNIDKNDFKQFQNNFLKKRSEQLGQKSPNSPNSPISPSTPNTPTTPTTPTSHNGLSYVSSVKNLDPQQRIRMRKSSYDYTQSWLKPIHLKKKTQRKFILTDFQKISELGSGKYGKVFLVKQKQSQFICALKIIEKKMLHQQQITEQFIRELKIQSFLNHPNIIKMYGHFDDTVNIYIILEVALGGQLFKMLKKNGCMPEPKVALIMKQVVSAVNQLHSKQIIHRDIKPQNIVLNQSIVKLCDFGWSVYHGQSLRTTFCGTPLYVSPEILKGNNYDEKIDIWSLGIMMYEMLTGQNPFKITQQQQLIKIVRDEVAFPSYITISDQAKDFVTSCLKKNPAERLNIRQLINHEFFRKHMQKSPQKMKM